MSYSRFGWFGSEVYVYATGGDEDELRCCGCVRGAAPRPGPEFLLHLREHARAGDRVLDEVVVSIAADYGVPAGARAWALLRRIRWAAARLACRLIGHEAPREALPKPEGLDRGGCWPMGCWRCCAILGFADEQGVFHEVGGMR